MLRRSGVAALLALAGGAGCYYQASAGYGFSVHGGPRHTARGEVAAGLGLFRRTSVVASAVELDLAGSLGVGQARGGLGAAIVVVPFAGEDDPGGAVGRLYVRPLEAIAADPDTDLGISYGLELGWFFRRRLDRETARLLTVVSGVEVSQSYLGKTSTSVALTLRFAWAHDHHAFGW